MATSVGPHATLVGVDALKDAATVATSHLFWYRHYLLSTVLNVTGVGV